MPWLSFLLQILMWAGGALKIPSKNLRSDFHPLPQPVPLWVPDPAVIRIRTQPSDRSRTSTLSGSTPSGTSTTNWTDRDVWRRMDRLRYLNRMWRRYSNRQRRQGLRIDIYTIQAFWFSILATRFYRNWHFDLHNELYHHGSSRSIACFSLFLNFEDGF